MCSCCRSGSRRLLPDPSGTLIICSPVSPSYSKCCTPFWLHRMHSSPSDVHCCSSYEECACALCRVYLEFLDCELGHHGFPLMAYNTICHNCECSHHQRTAAIFPTGTRSIKRPNLELQLTIANFRFFGLFFRIVVAS